MNQAHPAIIMRALDFHWRPSERKKELVHINQCAGCSSYLDANPGVKVDVESMIQELGFKFAAEDTI